MKPETLLDGRVTIWRGDCRKVLPKVGSFAHVITDPPYEDHMHVAKAGARRVRQDGRRVSAPVNFAAIGDLRSAVMPLLAERFGGWFIAFCTPEGIAAWRDAIESAGLRYKRACFWEKPNCAPQFNGQGPAFGVEPFVTAWGGRGVSKWNGGGRRNLFTHMTNQPQNEGTHPTEKPLSLMLELIELFTNPGDVICDPFMGSGSTGVAALALGRKFIGIEIDQKYYALAKGRILSTFMGKQEGRALISKLVGVGDSAGPLFGGTP